MNGPDYDIHEKISQLETELLQHELLIRRQKHVINSLKEMITSPSNATSARNSRLPTETTSGRITASNRSQLTQSVPQAGPGLFSATKQNQPLRKTSFAVNNSSSSNNSNRNTTIVSNNKARRKAALNKVAQFCKAIPRFGSVPTPKRKRSPKEPSADVTAAAGGGGGASSNISKRQRGVSAVEEVDDPEDDPLFRLGFSQLIVPAARSQLLSSHPQNANSSSSSHTALNTRVNTMSPNSLVAVRPPIQVVKLPPPTSKRSTTVTSATIATSNKANSSTVSRTSSSIHSITGGSGSSSSSSASSSSVKPIVLGIQNTVQDKRTADRVSRQELVSTSTSKPSSRGTVAAASTVIVPSTPLQNNSSSSSRSGAIHSNRNLLSVGSANKSVDIIDHCKMQTSLKERLEIARDLYSNIQTNPRRLQHLLDSAGGRNLFITWMMESMDALSSAEIARRMGASSSATAGGAGVEGGAGGMESSGKGKGKGHLSAEEEVEISKLIEYCVMLINQAYWDAKSVSDLRFDKTLKNLYRLYEFKTEPHHVTVSGLVKSIWPSYRIMRKQHEGKTKASAVLIQ